MNAYPVKEFETVITADGSIKVPKDVLAQLPPGTDVFVRVTKGTIDLSLRSRGVSEDEIEEISHMQMEPRENVIRFLQSEGIFAKNQGFGRRSKVFPGKRT